MSFFPLFLVEYINWVLPLMVGILNWYFFMRLLVTIIEMDSLCSYTGSQGHVGHDLICIINFISEFYQIWLQTAHKSLWWLGQKFYEVLKYTYNYNYHKLSSQMWEKLVNYRKSIIII